MERLPVLCPLASQREGGMAADQMPLGSLADSGILAGAAAVQMW